MARTFTQALKTEPSVRAAADGFVLDRARTLGKSGLRRTTVWQIARVALRVGFSGTAAVVLGGLIMGENVDLLLVGLAATLLALAAICGLVGDRVQSASEAQVATGMRDLAGQRLRKMDLDRARSLPVGQTIAGLQRYPGAIASLVIGHRVARSMMSIGPFIAALALLAASWEAALTVVVLTPVMIVFFVLVGGTIRTRAEAQERAFGRLAGQFADRIRALPTILANDALAVEEGKLAKRLEIYASKTIGVLGIAFLNAGVIDFFASLSIAVLAVLLGLGHLRLVAIPGFSDLRLWQSLFILMIAPEYFAPFRRFAEAYHTKAEGEAAAVALDALLNPPEGSRVELPAVEEICRTLILPQSGLIVVCGPSGSGKSSLLRRLAGLEGADHTPVARLADGNLVWIAADSFVPEGPLGSAIAWNTNCLCPTRLSIAAERLGLIDDQHLPGGLDAAISANGVNLSGGQRMRIAVARSLVSNRTVIADEPTAKLDALTASLVRTALSGLAKMQLVIVATHDPVFAGIADLLIHLDATNGNLDTEVAA